MILKAFSGEYFKELKKLRKERILFFNGCFDIIHVGHLHFINYVKAEANKLWGSGYYKIICGLNSDISLLNQNKSHKPVNNEDDRAALLEHLDVDVVIFDEKDPTALLMSLVPDAVVKAENYMSFDYPEKEFLYKANIPIKYVKLLPGKSSTNIYNKIVEQVKEEIRRNI